MRKTMITSQVKWIVLVFWIGYAAKSDGQVFKGVVIDGKRQPVEAASISVKGSLLFRVADVKGEFSFPILPGPVFTIVISSAGFVSKELTIREVVDSVYVIVLEPQGDLTELVITSRRKPEGLQQVPISVSVVGGSKVDETGAFNVNRLKELVPSVQLYSSNPRNTTLNIRGLGSTFGLTNDGIDPGVGFYVDGVYYARPAATTLDFVDIERIEVLRGPQGTLFGKNTTAGAFNITSRSPKFKSGAILEISYGNNFFVQAKTSVTGKLAKNLAGRISFSGTRRNGVIQNIATERLVNDINNIGLRGQLLFTPTSNSKIQLIADYSDQQPEGYAQVLAGVVTTKRPGYRQFDSIIADLGYKVPTLNAFERIVDHNTPWRSGNRLGGISVNKELRAGSGTFTSTSAWRSWKWQPSNDRDFTGLDVLHLSQAPSKHQQWTQEFRYVGNLSSRLKLVTGIFLVGQELKTDSVHTEESGNAQWRFSKSSNSSLWATPGLLDGYGIRTNSQLKTFGAAVFSQVDWAVTSKFHVLPGIRYNYDRKSVKFNRKTYGGLQTTDPQLLALQRSVYSDQFFETEVDESNISGQLTLSYQARPGINVFTTWSASYKPVGVNLGGLPTQGSRVMLELATVKPEYVSHWELGIKSNPDRRSTLNLAFYRTMIRDYQTQVQTAEVGVNRGYLANAEKVSVWGVELETACKLDPRFSFNASISWSDARYLLFTNAPLPLEETGSAISFKDISHGLLPGVSKWMGSFGIEWNSVNHHVLGNNGNYSIALDNYFRSSFSSSPSPSKFLNIGGYSLFNLRIGFRSVQGISFFAWGRNIFDKDYYEQLLPAAGNAGHYAAVLGDPGSFGITIRYQYQKQ